MKVRLVVVLALTLAAFRAAASTYDYQAAMSPDPGLQTLPDGRTVALVRIYVTNLPPGAPTGPAYNFTFKVKSGGQEVFNVQKKMDPLPYGTDAWFFKLTYPAPQNRPGAAGWVARNVDYTLTEIISPTAGDSDPTNNSLTRTYSYKAGGTLSLLYVSEPRPRNPYDYRTAIDRNPTISTLPDGRTAARVTTYVVNDGPSAAPKYKYSFRITTPHGEVCRTEKTLDGLPDKGMRTYVFQLVYRGPLVPNVPGAIPTSTDYTFTSTIASLERPEGDTNSYDNADTSKITLKREGTPTCP